MLRNETHLWIMHGRQTEMQDETMKEGLGLGDTNYSRNLNRKQFLACGKECPYSNSIDRDERGGDLTTVFDFFLYFTMHKKLKLQQQKN